MPSETCWKTRPSTSRIDRPLDAWRRTHPTRPRGRSIDPRSSASDCVVPAGTLDGSRSSAATPTASLTALPEDHPTPHPAHDASSRRGRDAPTKARYTAPVPCCSWRLHRPRHLAEPRVVSGARRGRDRETRPVPPAPYLRDRGTCLRHLDLRARSAHGSEREDDRQALRPPRSRLRGRDPRASRRSSLAHIGLLGLQHEDLQSQRRRVGSQGRARGLALQGRLGRRAHRRRARPIGAAIVRWARSKRHFTTSRTRSIRPPRSERRAARGEVRGLPAPPKLERARAATH